MLYTFVLGFAASLVSVTTAQSGQSDCHRSEFELVNASVTNWAYALAPQNDFHATDVFYNISTAVKQSIDKSNKSIVTQDFWLKATTPITTSPLDLPFAGCAFFLRAAPGSKLVGADIKNEDQVCDAVLPGACLVAIRHHLSSNVTILPEQALNDNTGSCSTVADAIRTPPEECKGYEWDEVITTRR